MMTPEEIYEWLMRAPCRARAVTALPDRELLAVTLLLERMLATQPQPESGELLGLGLVERSERWETLLMMQADPNAGGGR
jgi:hypothetical protein